MIRALPLLLLALIGSGCVRWSPPSMIPASGGPPCRTDALRWFSPDDRNERRRLDAWCAGVGPPLIQRGAHVGAQSVSLGAMTFVSWNVHVGNGDIRAFVKDLRAGTHAGRRPIEHFVLMLQEAVRTGSVPPFPDGASGATRISSSDRTSGDIQSVSDDLGLSLIYVPSMRNGQSRDAATDRGSAILSTLPLSEPIAVELPGERQRRVAIFAKAGAVSVGVIHLDALGGPRRLWGLWTPWMRTVQVDAMTAVLPDGPLVLGADLNTWHGIDERAVRLLRHMPDATPAVAEQQGLGLRVLDYLFFRAGAARRAHYRQLSQSYGSDHKPLIGWIE
jgi:endonuclease/exonuclease/phosphatase family metal-dependent hydrolase